MSKKYNVTILGYGEMGHAMQALLGSTHHLSFWDKQPHKNSSKLTLEQLIPSADFVFFCLPVNPHREIITRIKPLLKEGSICLSIAKGLDEAGQTAAQVFQQVLSEQFAYALVYGPMISEELRLGRYGFAQLGCLQNDACRRTLELFRHSQLYLQPTKDINGISWSVILKNVYAMLFGMADELKLGDNMRGFLAVESVRELDSIVSRMGGKSASPYHLAGLGDLITTATSESSHHHSLGRQLAKGNREDIAGEGVHTLAMVEKHKLFSMMDFPLFTLVNTIINEPVDIEEKLIHYVDAAKTRKTLNQ